MELGKFGVTSIGTSVFSSCTNLIKVDLSKISILGEQAFRDCINFAGDGSGDLILPSLTSIGKAAFGGLETVQCSGLDRILDLGSITTLPNSGNNAGVFRNQTSLTEVYLPETLTTIGSACFEGCSSLTNINFPSSLTAINAYAFNNCTNLAIKDLVLPNLKTIDINAFNGVKITKISDLGKLTSLPSISGNENIFGDKTTLTSVNLPSTLTSIGNYVFNAYSSLSNVYFPPSLTRIGGGAFRGCTSLVDITLPHSITSIGDYAFHQCFALSIVIDLPNLETLGKDAFCMCSPNIGSLIGIENLGKITTIMDGSSGNYGCFRNQKSLTYAKLPNTLTRIGSYAFCGCSALNSITLPSSIISIGYGAFSGCTSLEIADLSLPNLETIGTLAFNGVKITKISNLGKLTSLQNINWNENIFGDKTTITSVNLPSTLTSIGNYVFSGYTNTEIDCNGAIITSIGDSALSRVKKVSNINISQVTSIPNYAFFKVGSFDETFSLNVPNLTNISNRAFSNSGITKIENLGKITSIPDSS